MPAVFYGLVHRGGHRLALTVLEQLHKEQMHVLP